MSQPARKGIGFRNFTIGTLGSVALVFYGLSGPITKTWNPVKQYHSWKQGIPESRKYHENMSKVFGPQGYADTNKDGIISEQELHDALGKVGAQDRAYLRTGEHGNKVLFIGASDLERLASMYGKPSPSKK